MTHQFKHGDIILVYTDGVSDNFNEESFLVCFKEFITNEGLVMSYGIVADCIARLAYSLGRDTEYDSPFA